MLGCNLTLKQRTNGLLMLKGDCPVTQLLVPTVSLELSFTCPCPGPGHRAKQEEATPHAQRIEFFGSLRSRWSFPECFVFTADDFLGLKYVRVSLGPRIGCGPALIPVRSKSHTNCSRNRLVSWLTAWKYCTQRNVAFQTWMGSTAPLQYFVRLDGQIICGEAKYSHVFFIVSKKILKKHSEELPKFWNSERNAHAGESTVNWYKGVKLSRG